MGADFDRWSWLRSPGFDDPDRTERAKILHVAVVATVVAAMLAGWKTVLPETVPVVAFYLALSLVAVWGIHRGHLGVVGSIYCTLTWAAGRALARPDHLGPPGRADPDQAARER